MGHCPHLPRCENICFGSTLEELAFFEDTTFHGPFHWLDVFTSAWNAYARGLARFLLVNVLSLQHDFNVALDEPRRYEEEPCVFSH